MGLSGSIARSCLQAPSGSLIEIKEGGLAQDVRHSRSGLLGRSRALLRRDDLTAYALIAPGYLIYFLFILVPVFVGFYYSFTFYPFYGEPELVGFRNYQLLVSDDVFLTSVRNTAVYTVSTVIPQMVLGLLLAVLLNGAVAGRKTFRAMIFIPHVTSMVAASMIWLWVYDPAFGFANQALRFFGYDAVEWLQNTTTALPSLIVMGIWKALGYNMVIYLAGLQTIPTSYYEVADIDGASPIRKFFSVTVPLLKPTSFFLLVMNTIFSFRVFEQVNIMTGGGPLNATTTIVHQIYVRAFSDFRLGYASSMAMVLLVVIAAVTFLNFRLGGSDVDVD